MRHSMELRQHRIIWENDRKHLGGIIVKASYVFLQQFDLVLSILGSFLGARELNPVMANLLTMPVQLLVIKLVIPIIIAWFIPSRFLIPAIALLLTIIGWNMKELLLLAG